MQQKKKRCNPFLFDLLSLSLLTNYADGYTYRKNDKEKEK